MDEEFNKPSCIEIELYDEDSIEFLADDEDSMEFLAGDEESMEFLADNPVPNTNPSHVKLIEITKRGTPNYQLLFYNCYHKRIPGRFTDQAADYLLFKVNFIHRVSTQNIDEDSKFKVLKRCIENVNSLNDIQKWSNDPKNITKAFEIMDKKYGVKIGESSRSSEKNSYVKLITEFDKENKSSDYKLLFFNKIQKKVPRKFSGKASDYLTFKVDFEYHVWTQDIDEESKFKVLKRCIGDVPALNCITKWPIRSKIIEDAFEFIDSIYRERVDEVIDQNIRKCNIAQKYNFHDLQTLYFNLLKTIKFCESLNSLDSYKNQINEAILEKVPSDIKNNFLNISEDNLPTLDDVKKVLLQEIQKYDASSSKKFSKKRAHEETIDEPSESNEPSGSKKRFKKSDQEETIDEPSDSNAPFCKFDNGRHSYENCKLSHKERMKIAYEIKLCRCCLEEGHSTTNCPNFHTCVDCRQRHHHYLCPLNPLSRSQR